MNSLYAVSSYAPFLILSPRGTYTQLRFVTQLQISGELARPGGPIRLHEVMSTLSNVCR